MTARAPLLALVGFAAAYATLPIVGVDAPAAVHAVVGPLLVLYLPGATLTWAFGLDTRTFVGPVLLAVGASLAEVTILGVVLDALPTTALVAADWRAGLAALVAGQAGLTLAVRGHETLRVPPAFIGRAFRYGALALPATAILAAAVALSVVSARVTPETPFTQLWALPSGEGRVSVGVRNREGGSVLYPLELRDVRGRVVDRFLLDLADGEAWEREFALGRDAPTGAVEGGSVVLGIDAVPGAYRQVDLPVLPEGTRSVTEGD